MYNTHASAGWAGIQLHRELDTRDVRLRVVVNVGPGFLKKIVKIQNLIH